MKVSQYTWRTRETVNYIVKITAKMSLTSFLHRYENERRPQLSLHKNSLSRRYSMIEDGDYSAASPATKKSHYTASPAKQPSMQTSRLSVFLQQSRDPAPSHASFTKPAGYSFSTVYSHDSPAVRRTRNDDEFYGSGHQQRSSSSRRSGRGQSSHTHLFICFYRREAWRLRFIHTIK